jgi:hypothetical protein
MTQIHSTQVVTPFGSGYVPEDHGPAPALGEPRKRSGARQLAIVLIVALVAATTAAAAITASSRNCAPMPSFLEPNPPSFLKKLPGAFGPDEMLF